MRHWNYRVIKRTVSPVPESGNEASAIYGIHDCYYDSQGRIHSFSVEPLRPCGDTLEELQADLERMQHAFNSPVLDYDKLPDPDAVDEPEEELDLDLGREDAESVEGEEE